MYLLCYNPRSCSGIHQLTGDDRLSPGRSRFKASGARATCSAAWWNFHPSQIIRYRRDSYPRWHVQETGRCQRKHQYVGHVWHRSSLHCSPHQRHCTASGCTCITGTPSIPLLHRVWHNVFFLQEGEEISMECMESIALYNRYICWSRWAPIPSIECRVRELQESRAIHSEHVCQDKSPNICQWRQEGTVLSSKSSHGVSTTHTGITNKWWKTYAGIYNL